MNRSSKIFSCFLVLLTLVVSCGIERAQTVYIGSWQERELPFSESIEFQISNDLLGVIVSEKWCCGTEGRYQWLRQEENLLLTFNTLKLIGLTRFISSADYNKTLFESDHWEFDWKGLSLNMIVRNMIESFESNDDSTDYFQGFWKRRRADGNENAVLEILTEVDLIYNQDKQVKADIEINEPLFLNLIRMNVELNESDSLTRPRVTLTYFDYLKNCGLEQSAYNLVFELEESETLKLNRDSLLHSLQFDTIPEEQYWQTRNDAQWIKTYRDNGP